MRYRATLLGALPFALLLLAWWLVTHVAHVPPATLPTPESVVAAAISLVRDGELADDVLVSLGRILLGGAVSMTLGIGLGILLGLRRRLADLVLPLATFFNAMSGIAWIPLAITWFGLGTTTVIFIIWNSMFFLALFNTVLGVRSVPQIYVHGLVTLGGGPWQVLTGVLVPGALPHILAGVRSGLAFGWRALVAGELVGATSGLGFLIWDASQFFRTDEIVLGDILIALVWIAMDRLLLVPLERRTVGRWGAEA